MTTTVEMQAQPLAAASCLETDGFVLREAIVSDDGISRLLTELSPSGRSPNLRSVLRLSPTAASIARSGELHHMATELLGAPAFPVRAMVFDKVAEANWSVAWHQDLAVPLRERIETPGFSSWSVKDGIPHAFPPVSVLEGMVTLRLHLDDCTAENGPLRVLPGTHCHGRLDESKIEKFRSAIPEEPIVCKAGAVFAMRPLLLHASSRSLHPRHRRVLHVEYAAQPLPPGLQWPD